MINLLISFLLPRVVGSSPVLTQAVSTHQHMPVHHNGHGITSRGNIASPAATNGHSNDTLHHHHSVNGTNHKVMEDATELFSGHSELTLDPSLSEIAIQVCAWCPMFSGDH